MLKTLHHAHKSAVGALVCALLGFGSGVQAQEAARDPFSACVAAEAAKSPGSVLAEARARQKCRKLYPAQTSPAAPMPAARIDGGGAAPAAVPSGATSPTAASPATPTAAAVSPTLSTPTANPMPSVPSTPGGNPHGGPPGLNK